VKTLALRWLKFNFVGGLGIIVQLAILALLVSGMHVSYLPATAVAVETAVLHNFVWHERFTWKDRTAGRKAVASRLVKFHLGNGLISIAGNLALMALFVGALHMKYLLANVITIALCSLLNFAASEWFVFRTN
jgi:putative flippase GtrA